MPQLALRGNQFVLHLDSAQSACLAGSFLLLYHLLLAKVVQTNWTHRLVAGLHYPHPQRVGEEYFSLPVEDPLCEEPLDDVVDCGIRRRADHYLSVVAAALQIFELRRQQPHESWRLARSRRTLQHHYALLPQNHLPDRLQLRLVENDLQAFEDVAENLLPAHEHAHLQLHQSGVQDHRRQIRKGHVSDCLVFPVVSGEFVEIVEVGLSSVLPQQHLHVVHFEFSQRLHLLHVFPRLGSHQDHQNRKFFAVLWPTVHLPLVCFVIGEQSDP